LQMRALGKDRRRDGGALARGRLTARAKWRLGREATWHARKAHRATVPAPLGSQLIVLALEYDTGMTSTC